MTATKISVPGIADSSETLTITGTKEGIEKAEHEIRVCSEEQVKYLYFLIFHVQDLLMHNMLFLIINH